MPVDRLWYIPWLRLWCQSPALGFFWLWISSFIRSLARVCLSLKGCKYGDRSRRWCTSTIRYLHQCYSFRNYCCGTCNYYRTGPTGDSRTYRPSSQHCYYQVTSKNSLFFSQIRYLSASSDSLILVRDKNAHVYLLTYLLKLKNVRHLLAVFVSYGCWTLIRRYKYVCFCFCYVYLI